MAITLLLTLRRSCTQAFNFAVDELPDEDGIDCSPPLPILHGVSVPKELFRSTLPGYILDLAGRVICPRAEVPQKIDLVNRGV